MSLKVISALTTSVKLVLEKALPAVYGTNANVYIGKTGDPNAPIKYPAIYVFRSELSMLPLGINNLQDTQRLIGNPQAKFISMYSGALILELKTESYMQWEELADQVVRVMMVAKPLMEKKYRLHQIANPTIGTPEISEQGSKVWVGQITFPITREIRWGTFATEAEKSKISEIALDVFDNFSNPPSTRITIKE